MIKVRETRGMPREDDAANTMDVVIATARRAFGFFTYAVKAKRVDGRVVSVEVMEKRVGPDSRAAKLLEEQGVKYKMIRAEQE